MRTRFLGIGVRPEHVKTPDIAAGRTSSAQIVAPPEVISKNPW
jgi:hypothetical protein